MSAHIFASKWQLPFLNQWEKKKKNNIDFISRGWHIQQQLIFHEALSNYKYVHIEI